MKLLKRMFSLLKKRNGKIKKSLEWFASGLKYFFIFIENS